MWGFIFLGFAIVTILGFVYVWCGFRRFEIIKKIAGESKLRSRLFGLIPMVVIAGLMSLRLIAGVVAFVHLLIFWIAFDLIAKLIKKKSKIYLPGVLAIFVSIVYLSIAWYYANTVIEVDYKLETDKLDDGENFRVAMFADSHLGCTFDGEKLAEYLKDIEGLNPDILVIVGDFVDDDSKKKDLERACEAFADTKTKYGIYYVYGNHDKGYGQGRDFSAEDLANMLTDAGVIIMEDDISFFDNGIALIGRQDKSAKDRKPISELVEGLEDNYKLVLNHQPNDQKAEQTAGVDLVLSGHTHGGQMLPINYMGEFFGLNDQTKGIRVIGNSTFIVTSGISDWAVPFKTGCRSEYLIIDINGTKESKHEIDETEEDTTETEETAETKETVETIETEATPQAILSPEFSDAISPNKLVIKYNNFSYYDEMIGLNLNRYTDGKYNYRLTDDGKVVYLNSIIKSYELPTIKELDEKRLIDSAAHYVNSYLEYVGENIDPQYKGMVVSEEDVEIENEKGITTITFMKEYDVSWFENKQRLVTLKYKGYTLVEGDFRTYFWEEDYKNKVINNMLDRNMIYYDVVAEVREQLEKEYDEVEFADKMRFDFSQDLDRNGCVATLDVVIRKKIGDELKEQTVPISVLINQLPDHVDTYGYTYEFFMTMDEWMTEAEKAIENDIE